MADQRIELRAVIRYLFLKGISNKEIADEINECYGNGEQVVSLSMVKYWTLQFRQGRELISDKVRTGRPTIPGLADRVIQELDQNPFLSQKKLSVLLGIEQRTIHRVLVSELCLVRVSFRWIPHNLTQRQKEERVKMASELATFLEDPRVNHCNVITGDETFVYLDNTRQYIWQEAGLNRPEKPKRMIGDNKVMFTVFWSSSGIQSISALPRGIPFTKSYFESTLDSLATEVRKRRRALGTNGLFVHFDNATPHRVPEKIESLGMTRLPHPPCSPDLAPTDFFLFGYLKTLLQGTSFGTAEELQGEVSKILKEIPKHTFAQAYEEWKHRLRMCIEKGGEYV